MNLSQAEVIRVLKRIKENERFGMKFYTTFPALYHFLKKTTGISHWTLKKYISKLERKGEIESVKVLFIKDGKPVRYTGYRLKDKLKN